MYWWKKAASHRRNVCSGTTSRLAVRSKMRVRVRMVSGVHMPEVIAAECTM